MALEPLTYEDDAQYRGMLAIQVGSKERLAFLRKVYSLLGLALTVFAVVAWTGVETGWTLRLLAPVYAMGWFAPIGIMLGLFLLLRLSAASFPVNVVALLSVAGLLGVAMSPMLAFLPAAVIGQAAGLTGGIFGGLTLYALTTKKDFQFLGAALWIGFGLLLAFGIITFLMGGVVGIGYHLGWVVIWSGFILYDTSSIMRRYPTTMAAAAAAALFLDVAYLFWHLASLFQRE